MKQNGSSTVVPSKKTKIASPLKNTSSGGGGGGVIVGRQQQHRAVMKTAQAQTPRKKKDPKPVVASNSDDTISETIAFVVEHQSAVADSSPPEKPVKGASGKDSKLSKERLSAGKTGRKITKDAKSAPAKEPKTKKSKSPKKNKCGKSLDTSIKELIKKYAKKLNIQSEFRKKSTEKKGAEKVKTNGGLKTRKSCAKQPQLDNGVKNEAEAQPPEQLQLKIKEEKVDDEAAAAAAAAAAPSASVVVVKIEPEVEKTDDGGAPEPTTPAIEIKEEPKPVVEPSPKKCTANKRLLMLKRKALAKTRAKKQLVDDKRRAKLLQFWNSPKRHRVASLNALAKVHCLYENESKAIFDKITETAIVKREGACVETRGARQLQQGTSTKRRRETSSSSSRSDSSISTSCNNDNSESDDEEEDEDKQRKQQPVKRKLRDAPGLRAVGKHWDMHDSISSDTDADQSRTVRKKGTTARVKKERPSPTRKTNQSGSSADKDRKKRKAKKEEIYMDLKDMVVKKRMASLNASAILAASYSNDNKKVKSRDDANESSSSSSYDSDSSAEAYFAAIEEIDLTKHFNAKEVKRERLEADEAEDEKKSSSNSNNNNNGGNVIEVHATPNKKVAVILNQDTDVTITGVYVNSTTRSTHHEGYCSVAGMQYLISATQTAATSVTTETILQSGSSSDNAHSDVQSCSSKSYTPLDALSNMQPPPGPGIHSAPPGIPCQSMSRINSPPHRQHPASSKAFASPHRIPAGFPPAPHIGGPPLPPPPGPAEESPVVSSSACLHGYYQPAGPLISVPHGHSQPPFGPHPPLPKSVPLSEGSPTSVASSTNQLLQPPRAPGSHNGDSSDNEVIITSVTSGTKEPPPLPPTSTTHQPTATYRYPAYSQYHAYSCAPPPPQYHYQTPPPPTPPYTHHEMCYPTTAPPTNYLRHSKYVPTSVTPYHHRYSYFSPGHAADLYGAAAASSQQIVTASPVTAGGTGSYATAPPPTAIIESYPPPPVPPTLVDAYQASPHYYQSTFGMPPACYSHSPTRAIPYINAAYQPCPCPLNSCPKNGHTGPLTGESKRSNISKDSKPLPPVALALPLEPVSATGPPSPARGSAGMPPPPSPAGANYQPPPPPVADAVPPRRHDSGMPEGTKECCKVEKRKARVGKANVRNNMQNTMLLMCNPTQDFVKREIESPKDKEELDATKVVATTTALSLEGELRISEAAPKEGYEVTTDDAEVKADLRDDEAEDLQLTMNVDCPPADVVGEVTREEKVPPIEEYTSPPPKKEEKEDEPLPPCVATVAETVKVKNMKRKQSQSQEKVPEVAPPPVKKKRSSYKDLIKKDPGCFKINNSAKNLVSKPQLPKIKIQTSTKKRKIGVSKQQTNNRRMKVAAAGLSSSKKRNHKKKIAVAKSAPKILDNLIAKNNIDKVIDDVIGGAKPRKSSNLAKIVVPKTTGKIANRRKSTAVTRAKIEVPEVDWKPCKKTTVTPKWSNGWTWEGEPYEGKVFINSDETTVARLCYPTMRHKEGDLIRPGDCVLLKAGPRKNDLPYVAKIAALWENPEDGEMMMSLLWYYRPEHTEQGRLPIDQPDEVFASRHKDSNSVACIDDKCYVLTFNEYCRYKKTIKRIEEGLEELARRVPLPDPYPRLSKQPPTSNISPEMVFFCRKVYDFRQKRIVKNPT